LGTATAGPSALFLALVIAYVTTRRVIAGHRLLGFLATAPGRGSGIGLGVGLLPQLHAAALRAWMARCGSADRVSTINLPSLSAIAGGISPPSIPKSRRQPDIGAKRLQSLRQITAPLSHGRDSRPGMVYFHRRDARAFAAIVRSVAASA